MARFVPSPGLDEKVARMVEPTVREIMARIAAAVAMNAPDGRYWLSMQDERVRNTHWEADGQTIPANVPYILHKPNGGGTETADRPRDPALSIGNRINCRCVTVTDPGAIARTVTHDTRSAGPSVVGRVEATYPRVAESEFAQRGGGWMLGSARDVLLADPRQ